MRRLIGALGVTGLVALAACSGADGRSASRRPDATLAPATTSSSTTAVADPYAIPADPADIDVAYVQRVVDALYEVDAQATREFLTAGAITPSGIAFLDAAYSDSELNRQLFAWSQVFREGRASSLVPGVLRNDVQRVLNASRDCVYIQVLRRYDATTTALRVPNTVYLGLQPTSRPLRMNPTPWELFMDGINDDGSTPVDPCS